MTVHCEQRLGEGGSQFWCRRFEAWFLASGLECRRCRAGLPVTTEAYREWIREDGRGYGRTAPKCIGTPTGI